MNPHLLTGLLVLPLFGMILLLCLPRTWERALKIVGVGTMLLEFALSLQLLAGDYSTAAYQFVERYPWIITSTVRIHYHLGVDGISLWLVLLTTFISPIALYASWSTITTRIKEYAFAFLLLELAMLGVFFSLDLFLFYVFWELMLVPMYLIIGVWGHQDRVYAALKFFLYTTVGGLLMLIAILVLVGSYAKASGGPYTFELAKLTTLVLPASTQYWLFAAFALAFAIKVPMVPFHTWLPDAHVQAPTGGSVVLASVLLKLGIYGFLRFAMPLFPIASQFFGPTLAMLGVVGILYGACVAWVQRDLKKLVAYSSVAHMGFILLGMFAMEPHAVEGAILQMLNHGVSTGALFILVGVIYQRRHTRLFDDLGGLMKPMPIYCLVFVVVTMSSIGLPGTNGFVGEFMILSGAWLSRGPVGLGHWWLPMTLFATAGVIFAAIYMLHCVLRMFWGTVTHEENAKLPDLHLSEKIVLAPLIVLIFWIGFFPMTFLKPMQPSVANFLDTFDARYRQALLMNVDEPQILAALPSEPTDPASALAYADDAAPATHLTATRRAIAPTREAPKVTETGPEADAIEEQAR